MAQSVLKYAMRNLMKAIRYGWRTNKEITPLKLKLTKFQIKIIGFSEVLFKSTCFVSDVYLLWVCSAHFWLRLEQHIGPNVEIMKGFTD